MRRLIVGAALAISGCFAAGASANVPPLSQYYVGGATPLVVLEGDSPRIVDLYVPTAIPSVPSLPLVIVLHGFHGDQIGAESEFGFDSLADRAGLLVAYPYGYNSQQSRQPSWNAGRCCGYSSQHNIDDERFLVDVVHTIALSQHVDLHRVYVTGFSNGGMMALKLACDRPDIFAAAASVSGTLEAPCTTNAPAATLYIHGLDDTTVPFKGSRYAAALEASLTPVPQALAMFAKADRCAHAHRTETALGFHTAYDNCVQGRSIELLALNKAGHHWPTTSSAGIDGASTVWDFLQRFATAG